MTRTSNRLPGRRAISIKVTEVMVRIASTWVPVKKRVQVLSRYVQATSQFTVLVMDDVLNLGRERQDVGRLGRVDLRLLDSQWKGILGSEEIV